MSQAAGQRIKVLCLAVRTVFRFGRRPRRSHQQVSAGLVAALLHLDPGNVGRHGALGTYQVDPRGGPVGFVGAGQKVADGHRRVGSHDTVDAAVAAARAGQFLPFPVGRQEPAVPVHEDGRLVDHGEHLPEIGHLPLSGRRRLAENLDQGVDVERFLQQVEGPQPQRVTGQMRRRKTRDDDYRQAGVRTANGLQQVQAGPVGQGDVGNHQVDFFLLQGKSGLLKAARRRALEMVVCQGAGQHGQQCGVVVDHQDAGVDCLIHGPPVLAPGELALALSSPFGPHK